MVQGRVAVDAAWLQQLSSYADAVENAYQSAHRAQLKDSSKQEEARAIKAIRCAALNHHPRRQQGAGGASPCRTRDVTPDNARVL
jgi:hypothetical protein